MEPIAVRAGLLQALLPEPSLLLRPGATVLARVAARPPGELATLVLAGVPLAAELPDEVAEGQTLRLTVTAVTQDQVLMKLDPLPPPPAPPPGAEAARARVAVGEPARRGRGPGGEEEASVALVLHSAVLGQLDLRVTLRAGEVRADVVAPAGDSHAAAAAAADALRQALREHVGRPAAVSVTARRAPLDVYA
jgi:hypothetical protein